MKQHADTAIKMEAATVAEIGTAYYGCDTTTTKGAMPCHQWERKCDGCTVCGNEGKIW
jgi:hypothetical protein